MPSRKPDRNYGRNFRSAKASFKPNRYKSINPSALRSGEATFQDEKLLSARLAHIIDESMGFARYESGRKRTGWLCNMHSTSVEDDKIPGGRAAVDYYFLEDDGGSFKATVEHDPYFLLAVSKGREAEVEEWCRRKFEGLVKGIKRIEKEDLQMPNHLLGYRRLFLQMSFHNVGELLEARSSLMPLAESNKNNMTAMDTYAEVARWVPWMASVAIADGDSQARTLDLICSTMNEVMGSATVVWQMQATMLSISENMTFLTMCE